MEICYLRKVFFGAVLVVSSIADFASAKPAINRTAASSKACTRLYMDMEQLKKSLAMNFADGIGDNSAARATMREAQDLSLMARVRLTMDLMRDNHCRMPTSVPTGVEYSGSAITCKVDMMNSGTSSPPSCDQAKWVPKPR